MGETAYIFGRGIDDRQRLEYQFTLLRTDFDAWFDEALRLGGRSSDPAGADWSVLDLGCGEGQYSREIARRYPHATVLGADLNPAAVAAAGAATEPNARFLVHDAAEPLPPTEVPQGGFDVAVSWLVLLYLADQGGRGTPTRDRARRADPGGAPKRRTPAAVGPGAVRAGRDDRLRGRPRPAADRRRLPGGTHRVADVSGGWDQPRRPALVPVLPDGHRRRPARHR